MIGEGIGFAAMVAAAVVLELRNKETGGLWFIIILWAMHGFN